MKPSTKRALSILFSVFFLIATIVVYSSLIEPEMGNSSELQSEVASKTNAYQNQKAAVSQVSKLISQFQNAAQLQQTLSLAMPVGPSVTDALNQWYTISQNSQASVQSLNIKLGKTLTSSNQPLAKGMGTITIDLGIVGTYDAVKQFLTSVESNARLINVTSFDFKPLVSSGQGGATTQSPSSNQLYSLQMTVNTFYQGN